MEVDGKRPDFDFFGDMKALINIILFVFGFFSRTVEVFLRRDIGERYLRFETLCITFLVLNLLSSSGLGANAFIGAVSVSGGLKLFAYAFLGVAIYHQLQIWRRNYNGNYSIHSFSFGKSWGIWRKLVSKDSFFEKLFMGFHLRFLEPGFVFLLALVTMIFDGQLGSFLMFAALSLFVTMHAYYKMDYTRFLDENDAQIAAQDKKGGGRFGMASRKPALGSAQPPGKATGGKSAGPKGAWA